VPDAKSSAAKRVGLPLGLGYLQGMILRTRTSPGGLGQGAGDGVGVDIQAHLAQVVRHWPAPFACSSAWFGSSDRVTYALRSRAGHSTVTSPPAGGVQP
jgi:hypothetical protein